MRFLAERSTAVYKPGSQSPTDPIVRYGVLDHRRLDIVLLRDLGCLLAGVALVHVG